MLAASLQVLRRLTAPFTIVLALGAACWLIGGLAWLAQLERSEFADAIGARLGIERLSQYPTLVTLCDALNKRHGTIHTDSRSKVATALIYFNDTWPDTSDGCLRFLSRIDDIDATVTDEVKPLFGNFVSEPRLFGATIRTRF